MQVEQDHMRAGLGFIVVGRTGFEPVTSSVSSLKERGRVIPEGAGPCQAGFYRSFVRVRGGWGHAGLARGPGVAAWGRGVPCSPAAADPGARPGWVKDRAEPGRRSRRRRASLTLRAAIRSSGGGGQAGVGLWWLRAPWAALVLARLAAVIPPGGPRLAAAGHGAGPRGQRDQSDVAAAARGGARHGSDHALPAAGPAHPVSCTDAAGVSRDLTCPSRIA